MPQGNPQAYRDAIASIESAGSGDYSAVGPPTNGSKPYGRYQVMDFNIGPWTRQFLGREMTPQEFLNDPAAQDAVFDGVFGGYVDRFGLEGAAQAWFGGPGSVGRGDRTDNLGTSVANYGRRFVNALGQGASLGEANSAARRQGQGAASGRQAGQRPHAQPTPSLRDRIANYTNVSPQEMERRRLAGMQASDQAGYDDLMRQYETASQRWREQNDPDGTIRSLLASAERNKAAGRPVVFSSPHQQILRAAGIDPTNPPPLSSYSSAGTPGTGYQQPRPQQPVQQPASFGSANVGGQNRTIAPASTSGGWQSAQATPLPGYDSTRNANPLRNDPDTAFTIPPLPAPVTRPAQYGGGVLSAPAAAFPSRPDSPTFGPPRPSNYAPEMAARSNTPQQSGNPAMRRMYNALAKPGGLDRSWGGLTHPTNDLWLTRRGF